MYKGKNVTSVAFFRAKRNKLEDLFTKTCVCQKKVVILHPQNGYDEEQQHSRANQNPWKESTS